MKNFLIIFIFFSYILYAQNNKVDYKPINPYTYEYNNLKDASFLIGFNAGSLGGGFDFSIKLANSFQVRYNYNSLDFNKNGVISSKVLEDLPYFARVNLYTSGVIFDYFPFESSSFHLSTGMYLNKNRANVKSTPKNKTMKIGDSEYSFDLLRAVNTKVDFNKEVPYLGFGFGGKIDKKGIGWILDIGVIYHGKPKVKMTPVYGVDSINTVNIKKAIDKEVKKEEINYKKKIKNYKYYPVVKFGLTYSF